MSTADIKETDVSLLSPEKVGSTVSQLKIKIKETLNTDSGGLTKKAACMQILMAILANITIISSGMGIGFPAITSELLSKGSMPLTPEQISWFASVTAITCPIGGLLAGYFLDKIGRKTTLILINIISIISWLILSFSSTTDVEVLFIQLIVARFIIGIGVGMSSSPAAVYAAEISHPSLRGRLTLLSALCTAIGMLFIYTLGFVIPTDWRAVSKYACGFTIFSMIVLLPIPESPSWLVGKNKLRKAEKSLMVIRGIKEVDDSSIKDEINMLLDNLAKFQVTSSNGKKKSKWRQLRKPILYKPLFIMITFFAFQQFSGIFVIMVYAAKFSIEAGVNINPFLCAVFIGLTRVLTTLVMGFVSDKFGRKPPAYFSGFGMACCMFGLSVIAKYPVKDTTLDWLPAFLIIAFMVSCTMGFLTLPFAMIAELYPQKVRGFASGLTIFAAYSMSFVTIKLYPGMVEHLGNVCVFAMYGCVSLCGLLFVYFILPETKGKSLEEIEDFFRGGKKKKKKKKVDQTSVESGGSSVELQEK